MLMFVANLEGDVVVRRRAAGVRVIGFVILRLVVATATAAPASTGTAPTSTAAAGTFFRAKHLQLVSGDFQLAVLLAVLFPAIELEPTFDQHGRAFAEILVGDFGRAAPQRDIDKRNLVDPLL